MDSEQIVIAPMPDEVLVFPDWLERAQMTDPGRTADGPAVWAPIHKIVGTLDKKFTGIFILGYAEHLEVTRRRLHGFADPSDA